MSHCASTDIRWALLCEFMAALRSVLNPMRSTGCADRASPSCPPASSPPDCSSPCRRRPVPRTHDRVEIPGLRGAASVVRDVDGVPHVKATNPHDLFFLQGWVHADDRLFQMDVTRRRASGTLAELIGGPRAAERRPDAHARACGAPPSAACRSQSPETQEALAAYAEGVNAWIARNPLPAQYATVQVTKVAPWTVVDSMVVTKALAFSLSFDLDIDRTTAVQAYTAAGFDGHTAVSQDLFPFAPFNTASPVFDATGRPPYPGGRGRAGGRQHRPCPRPPPGWRPTT